MSKEYLQWGNSSDYLVGLQEYNILKLLALLVQGIVWGITIIEKIQENNNEDEM